MDGFIGLDLGTTGVRAILVSERGAIISAHDAAHELLLPRPGWAESDAQRWWSGAIQTLAAVAADARSRGIAPAAIGLTGQMHGAVLLDGAGGVVRPPILWCDVRTGPQAQAAERALGSELVAVAGNPALPNFTATKLLWVREVEPERFGRVRHLLLPKDYIRYRLTGMLATDVTDASGTLLFDVARRSWSRSILAALELPESLLPPAFESVEVAGTLTAEAAAATGLPRGLPVAAGAGDQPAGAIGAGVTGPDGSMISLGTSGVVFVPTRRPLPDPDGRLHLLCAAVAGQWCYLGVTQAAAESLRWLSERVLNQEIPQLLEAAAQVPPGARGLRYLPYLMGERTPHLDAQARGAFFGLTARHGAADLTRAVLEGVAMSLRDAVELVLGLGSAVTDARVIGGGARSPLWRSILSAVLGMPVGHLPTEEGPALGAAVLAAVAVGAHASVVSAAQAMVPPPRREPPDPGAHAAYQRAYESYRALYPATAAIMHALGEEEALDLSDAGTGS